MNILTRKIAKTEAAFDCPDSQVHGRSFRFLADSSESIIFFLVLTIFLYVALLCGKKVKLAYS